MLKMKPVESLFRKRIKYKDGIPDDTLLLAHQFLLLTDEELEVIRWIKYGKETHLPEGKVKEITNGLIEKQIIVDN